MKAILNLLKASLIPVLLLAFYVSEAQINIGGQPYSFGRAAVNATNAPVAVMPAINLQQLQREDEQDALNGLPPRFGYPHNTSLNLNNSGMWKTMPNGDRIWQLKIKCPNAISINLLYNKFHLPEGSVFYIYNQNRNHVIGGFTSANNKGTAEDPGKFGTGLVYGSMVILEYMEPAAAKGSGTIEIDYVVHGYRQIGVLKKFHPESGFGDSGNCQVNVNCPEGNNWQDEKKGVALILSNGTRWCTGSLINNTAQDGTPYFLTADHCLTSGADAINNPNLAYWSFYWEYESSGCSDGMDFTPPSTNGATVVANNGASDFALLELTETPSDAGVNAYFNGWDRRNQATSNGVGIHHPSGDIKKVATHTQTPSYTSSLGANYWQVQWSSTANGFSVTEGGSSGSPLFNANSHIIGQLYGGSSINCADPANDPGIYGKVYVSWNNSTDPRRRLRDWLDPGGSAPNTLNGAYMSTCELNLTITTTINSGTQLFEASNTITASNIIDGIADVTYDAGNTVVLSSGFHASSGVDFTAKLGGCTESASVQLVQARAIDVSQKADAGLSSSAIGTLVYPNPGEGVFNIILNEHYLKGNDEPVRISLMDLKGRVIREEVLQNTNKAVFDITNKPTGVYLIRVNYKDEVETFRVVFH